MTETISCLAHFAESYDARVMSPMRIAQKPKSLLKVLKLTIDNMNKKIKGWCDDLLTDLEHDVRSILYNEHTDKMLTMGSRDQLAMEMSHKVMNYISEKIKENIIQRQNPNN